MVNFENFFRSKIFCQHTNNFMDLKKHKTNMPYQAQTLRLQHTTTHNHQFPQPHHTLPIFTSHHTNNHILYILHTLLNITPYNHYNYYILYQYHTIPYNTVIKTISNHITNYIYILFQQPRNPSIITISYSIKNYIIIYTRIIIIIIYHNYYNHII